MQYITQISFYQVEWAWAYSHTDSMTPHDTETLYLVWEHLDGSLNRPLYKVWLSTTTRDTFETWERSRSSTFNCIEACIPDQDSDHKILSCIRLPGSDHWHCLLLLTLEIPTSRHWYTHEKVFSIISDRLRLLKPTVVPLASQQNSTEFLDRLRWCSTGSKI